MRGVEVAGMEPRQLRYFLTLAEELHARSAAGSSPRLRVGIIDSSYDSMPQILHEVQARYPDLVIHQVEEAGRPRGAAARTRVLRPGQSWPRRNTLAIRTLPAVFLIESCTLMCNDPKGANPV
jgi:hypothetical protein